MKITIVTQYYPPEPIPIPQAVARGLAERGHDVSVVTGFPNYPQGVLYSGYRQRFGHVEKDGNIRVFRVPLVISHSNNPVGRLLNYLTFAASSFAAKRSVRKADVVYAYATQMTAAIGPAWWNRIWKLPFVMHVQDLWPESVTGSSMVGNQRIQKAVARILEPWLRRLYRDAAATIAIGPGMSRLLVERGVPADRIHTIFNWAETTQLPIDRDRRRDAESTKSMNVMYAGNVGDMQDLETVVRAAALVTDLAGFRISVVGSGVAEARVKALAAENGATNVEFFGRVPFTDMARHYEASDYQLVTLKDLNIFRVTIPSKLQSSLAVGIPVITTVAGDVERLVTERGLGFASEPGNAAALAETFRLAFNTSNDIRRQMGANAQSFYTEAMSRDSGVDAIERILASVAADTNKRKSNG